MYNMILNFISKPERGSRKVPFIDFHPNIIYQSRLQSQRCLVYIWCWYMQILIMSTTFFVLVHILYLLSLTTEIRGPRHSTMKQVVWFQRCPASRHAPPTSRHTWLVWLTVKHCPLVDMHSKRILQHFNVLKHQINSVMPIKIALLRLRLIQIKRS